MTLYGVELTDAKDPKRFQLLFVRALSARTAAGVAEEERFGYLATCVEAL